MMAASRNPPAALVLAIAAAAAGMLLVEVLLTRFFSVLFLYHYSFFAISLCMSGLTLGAIVVAATDVPAMEEQRFGRIASRLASAFAALSMAGLLVLVRTRPTPLWDTPTVASVVLPALAFLPCLVAAGALLALLLARRPAWVPRLYAADLAAAAAACLGTIVVIRVFQGPASLLAATALGALAALLLAPSRGVERAVAILLGAGACLGLGLAVATGGRHLALPTTGGDPIVDRWNEHSRITVFGEDRDLPFRRHATLLMLIDKSAATHMPRLPRRKAGDPIPVRDWWVRMPSFVGYRIGRPVERAAIIGVGGGRDLLAPLAVGAKAVDGYELNDTFVDLLRDDLSDYNGIASWPEVRLIHSEARVGLARAAVRYDTIQASLIDTWAATASGGFVLSENGLYTLEAWRMFLTKLTPRGILTFTRHWVPKAPAEAHRLVALGAAALEASGIPDARPHVAVVTAAAVNQGAGHLVILVSPSPFTAEEVARLDEVAREQHMTVLAAPGRPSADATIDGLLDPARRRETIEASPYDIAPPRDSRPYFFLLLRARDLIRGGDEEGSVQKITFNALRILALLSGIAMALAALVLLAAAATLPGARATPSQRRRYLRLVPYFAAIGAGYILVELGMMQRLTIVLGQPFFALAAVLFGMLLSTALGAACAGALRPERAPAAWAGMVATTLVAAALLPAVGVLDGVASDAVRALACGAYVGVVGFALGFGMPLGAALAATTGEAAIPRMWALNGAASIAGSSAAAFIGVLFGSQAVVVAGCACYAVAAVAGLLAMRVVVEPSAPGSTTPPGTTAIAAS